MTELNSGWDFSWIPNTRLFERFFPDFSRNPMVFNSIEIFVGCKFFVELEFLSNG